MATPNSGHTHGSNTPSSLTNYQTHSTYQQYQNHDQTKYEQPGLMPADFNGKEVYTGPPPQQQQQQQGYYPVQEQFTPPPHSAAPPPDGEKKILGMRKMTFFLVLLAGVLLVGAIGAGAAAGVIAGQKAGSSSGSNEPAASGTPSPSSSGPVVSSSSSEPPATTTSTRSAADGAFTGIPLPEEASGALGVNSPECPGSNLTETAIPGTDLVFVRECGVNYSGQDLGNIPMTNMQDCLNLCAAHNVSPQSSQGACVGVAWVYRGRQGTLGSFCWLKHSMGTLEYDERVESAWLKGLSSFGR